MKLRSRVVCAAPVAVLLVLAGCSTTTSSQISTSSSEPTSNTSGSSALAANLPATDALRTQLLAAGAGLNSIPVAEFTGLAPGLTYYALDKQTNIYWAGARLQPAPTPNSSPPSQAQISSQDAGSYYVFQQSKGGQWTAYAAGNEGPNTVCPIAIPPAVLSVWGWPAGGCRPSGA